MSGGQRAGGRSLTGGHWASLSAATSCTFRCLLCDFPRDFTSLCRTWRHRELTHGAKGLVEHTGARPTSWLRVGPGGAQCGFNTSPSLRTGPEGSSQCSGVVSGGGVQQTLSSMQRCRWTGAEVLLSVLPVGGGTYRDTSLGHDIPLSLLVFTPRRSCRPGRVPLARTL